MTYSVQPRQAGATHPQSWANRKLYLAIAGVLLLAVAAGGILKLTTANSRSSNLAEPSSLSENGATGDTDVSQTDQALIPATGDGATPFQSEPFLQASAPLLLADPSLLRSTSPQARVEAISSGRPDPFASIVVPGPRVPRPTPAAALLTPVPPQGLPTVTVSATRNLPALPEVAVQPVTIPNLPTPFVQGSAPPVPTEIAAASTGAPAFQSLIDQVVVSGVVQVGNGVSVIVTEPGSTVSRRVSAGDMLAGGRIKVKSVDLSGQEPIVILTFEGKDYTRTVGAPMVSAL
ncbi:hypothetical protein IQ254_24880 [Nodosilinea sp. LEGE 07088]|uniref:hypothetical protein n=1 Tax=Nodosilinea sp. LEGE 07088 TaxID=2777968 RepID=UPI00187F06BA|nr:hypothetical protein [Nodosilinea sp. LEGE 07088]MBE9140396.1 hypothetical protein [Nodosilinea sp. LEGE 07088]